MICQKQHRQNEPAGQVDIPTRVESVSKTKHRQHEPAGQVDIPTRVDPCDGGSWTDVGTTDISCQKQQTE